MYGTIGILTGGGDAPGLNAVIRAVVKTATCEGGMRVIGIEDGFEGLLGATKTRLLSPSDVRGLLPRGGTILGTRNRGHFADRTKEGVTIGVESVYQEAIANMKVLGIDALGLATAAKHRGNDVVDILAADGARAMTAPRREA